ncbi:MAG: DUF5107 domain-containing protein, partial [Bacteroidia bacterium]|nr:DUF5107 domain-containing protein [Bacteroidia bacterium]
ELVVERQVEVGNAPLEELSLVVFSEKGRELLSIKPQAKKENIMPDAAKPALSPEETSTCEQLYLTGLHIEQYRHATYKATDYYLEALKRDPSDVRNNNAMGLWLLRKGQFAASEPYFQTAIDTQLQRNPNPYDGEPRYNLGLAYQYQGKNKEAYDAFYKSCWNAAMQDAGYFGCAQISCLQNNLTDALEEVDKSLIRNGHNHKARALKTAILRKLDFQKEALAFIEESLQIDRFNFGCRFEEFLMTNASETLVELHRLMHGEIHNYEIVALDYIAAGMYQEAVQLLKEGLSVCSSTPMTYYYMGWALFLDGKESRNVFLQAAKHAPDYCFPNRLEAILALEVAQKQDPTDSKAPYYLGNLWYDKRQYPEAMACWEKSALLNDTFPTAYRNLALAYFNKRNQPDKAKECLEKAFELDTTDSRVFMELDQLYKRLGHPHSERLIFLESNRTLVEMRDDVYLEWVTLCNQNKQFLKAKALIDARTFHPWEGGEGKVSTQYQLCRIELAKAFIVENNCKEAIELLNQCLDYPTNLGEGKLYGTQENEVNYWLGCAYEQLNQYETACHYWELAKVGNTQPAAAIFYNDQKPDKIFYQGLAWLKLGRKTEACNRFNALISFGKVHMNDTIKLDYFAVSLPDLLIWDDDLTYRNKIHCNYLLGLGYLGLEEHAKAKKYLIEAAKKDINHQGVQVHLLLISKV